MSGNFIPYQSALESDKTGTNGQQQEAPIIEWPKISAPASKGYNSHLAVYPDDSILEDYMEYVRVESESADAFLIGSILPVTAAQLGRRVRFPWGSDVQFPNIYAMLAGPPGARKSSAIKLAEKLARRCLAESAFIPLSLSAETLFDEYDTEKGGQPDKLLFNDDALGLEKYPLW
jgi:hypothetical protein